MWLDWFDWLVILFNQESRRDQDKISTSTTPVEISYFSTATKPICLKVKMKAGTLYVEPVKRRSARFSKRRSDHFNLPNRLIQHVILQSSAKMK
jgi:hypothetical protein